MIRAIEYAGRSIEYELTHKDVININLNVRKDGKVYVSSGYNTPYEVVDEFVLSKASWVLENVEKFQEKLQVIPPKQYKSGESFVYLGNQYRLKVIKSTIESVDLFELYLIVSVKNPDNCSRIKNLVKSWYSNQLKEVLKKISLGVIDRYNNIFGSDFELRTLGMKARWGSCIVDKRVITLNSLLILAPKYCIEYVVLHELIHFKHRNHTKEYYAMLDNLMPDWRERKKYLTK